MVLALKCGIVLGKGPSWKWELWYHCLSGATRMVIDFKSSLAARRAQ